MHCGASDLAASWLVSVMEELALEYGERPFKTLESETIPLPDGGVTYGENLSYIRDGGVSTTGNTREYFLYVDNYSLSILQKDADQMRKSLPLTISVRYATDKELISRKQARGHYLQALGSTDPKVRLEAIHELGEMVSLGSTYAGNPLDIADAIRPFLKDEDAEIAQGSTCQSTGDGG